MLHHSSSLKIKSINKLKINLTLNLINYFSQVIISVIHPGNYCLVLFYAIHVLFSTRWNVHILVQPEASVFLFKYRSLSYIPLVYPYNINNNIILISAQVYCAIYQILLRDLSNHDPG
jgi:hypothetical protein